MSNVYQKQFILPQAYTTTLTPSVKSDNGSAENGSQKKNTGITLRFTDPAQALSQLFTNTGNPANNPTVRPPTPPGQALPQWEFANNSTQTPTSQQLERVLLAQVRRFSQWSNLSDIQRLSTTLQTVSLVGGILRNSERFSTGSTQSNQSGVAQAPSDLQLLNQSIGLLYGIQNFDGMSTAQQSAFLVNGLQQGTQILERLGVDPLAENLDEALGTFSPYVNGLVSSISYIENFDDLNSIQQLVGGAEVGAFASRLGQNASAQLGRTSTSSALGQVAGPLGTVASYAASAYAAYDIIDNFGALTNEQGAIDGATIGATIGSAFSPVGTLVGAGIGAVAGLALAQVNSGKDPEQKERDIYRSALQQAGVIDAGYQLTLADGSKYDIGIDDRYDREWYDKKLIGDNPYARDKMQPFDIDYTNNLDFSIGIAGSTLSRLLFGSSSQNDSVADQMGGYFTNAAISQSDREFSDANFQTGINNMFTLYEQAGLRSPQDVITRARQVFNEGKINELEYTQALQAADMVFNRDFTSAQRLVEFRFQAVR